MPSANTATALAPQHANTNTIQHHTLKSTTNSPKKWLGTIQKQQKIEENHVMWHPWAIPGHFWVLLGRPRGSKCEKVTKNVVRSPPSRDLFWSTFRSKIVFFHEKKASWSQNASQNCPRERLRMQLCEFLDFDAALS